MADLKNIKNSFCSSSLLLLAGIVLLVSCKKKDTAGFTDYPIIEAYLQPGSYFTLNVGRQIPFSDDVIYSDDDLNNLSPVVFYKQVPHVLTSIGNGSYIDSSLIVTGGGSYDLSFQFNSKNVSAYTYVPVKPANVAQSVTEIRLTKMDSTFTGSPGSFTFPDPVKITWDNADQSYYLLMVENIETDPEAVRSFGNGTPPVNRFRKQPTNFSSEEINSMEFQYFGTYRIILYHVLPDYAALYNQTSTSSQNLSNPSTSIVNGYGIFTGLNSDTLYVEVIKQ